MIKKIGKLIIGAILLIASIVALFPFFYMIITSLRQTLILDFSLDVSKMNFTNYITVFKNFEFFKYFKNSFIVAGLAVFFNCLFAALAGYGFAKKNFLGKNVIFNIYLASMMVPGQVTLIPVFVIMNKLGLVNTYVALFSPLVNAFGVFLMRQFMLGLPNDLLEAANIDGCSELRTFWSIVVPLVKPVIISLTVFTFISAWNDFVWPLVIATDASHHTLTLALSVLKGNYSTNYGLVMAGSALTFLPPFTLYIFLQKQFVEGIALSGIKG